MSCITCLYCLQGYPENGKMWMDFIDIIIIDQMGFESTTHDCCIYKKVIDRILVYILRQIDECARAFCNQKTAKHIFYIIGTKIRFKMKKRKVLSHLNSLVSFVTIIMLISNKLHIILVCLVKTFIQISWLGCHYIYSWYQCWSKSISSTASKGINNQSRNWQESFSP